MPGNIQVRKGLKPPQEDPLGHQAAQVLVLRQRLRHHDRADAPRAYTHWREAVQMRDLLAGIHADMHAEETQGKETSERYRTTANSFFSTAAATTTTTSN